MREDGNMPNGKPIEREEEQGFAPADASSGSGAPAADAPAENATPNSGETAPAAEEAPVLPDAQTTAGEPADATPAAADAPAGNAAPDSGKFSFSQFLAQIPKGAWLTLVVGVIIIIALFSGRGGVQPVDGPVSDLYELPSLNVQATSQGFAESGVFRLTGTGDLTADQVMKALTIEPAVSYYTVAAAEDGNGMTVTIRNHRNIAYRAIFALKAANGEEYRRELIVNGPALTVRVSSPYIKEYAPVTLSFSAAVDIDSLARHLDIPGAEYTLEKGAMQATLRPVDRWADGQTYQIYIDAGYTAMNGKQFADRQVLSFTVNRDGGSGAPPANEPLVNFVSSSASYVLDESREMTLLFKGQNLGDFVPLLVETYRMPSLERFREQGHIFLKYTDIPLDSLELVDTNAFLIDNGENMFTVPNHGEGAYFLRAVYPHPATGKQTEVRSSYLITSLSVYMQATAKETIVWLNSASAGTPLGNYRLVFDEGEETDEGVTDDSGLLMLPHQPGKNRNNFSVYDPAGSLVYYDDSSLGANYYTRDRYYSYLFMDRTLYRPEDTICFWGYAEPFRYNQNTLPETVTVTLDPGGLSLTVEAPISDSGVFTGEIPLNKIRSSQYALEASLNFPAEEGMPGTHHVLDTKYVSVREFEKPTFVLGSEVDETFYGPTDTVTVTATASFYDGTPLPRYRLEVSYYDIVDRSWVNLPDVTTDDMGVAAFSFPSYQGAGSPGVNKAPTTGQYKVQIADDGEQVTHVGGYNLFRSDTLIETAFVRQPEGENLSLTMGAYKLDLTSPQLAEAMALRASGRYVNLSNERLLEIAKGDPVDLDVELALRWSYHDQLNVMRQFRTGYYGNQTATVNYDYLLAANPHLNMAKITAGGSRDARVRFAAKNGEATINGLFDTSGASGGVNFDLKAYCRSVFYYTDGLGNKCEAYSYFPSYESYREVGNEGESQIIEGYSLAVTDLATGEDITPTELYSSWVGLDAESSARFSLLRDSQPTENEGRILYTILQDGLYEYHVTTQDSFDVNYKLDYGKNVSLVAAYFDGNKTSYVKQLNLMAKEESLAINLEVTPDRESYRPGDPVSLRVKATDSRGRGVAGNLCVAVVDEAIFALSEQYVDVLYELYGDMYSLNNSVSLYCTTYRDEPIPEFMGDMGKGGGEGVDFYDSYRSNFKDTALFLPAVTDGAGNATVSFTLPDNTTSWRITAVEVAKGRMGGNSKDNIISSLPFFCKPVITGKYIEGDDFSMLVQGHGTLLGQDSVIQYTVTVTGDGVSETKTASGKAYQPVEMNFGKLPMGSYTVVSRAQMDGYSDAVELPVSIIKSNLELVIHKEIDLTKPVDISAMRYPVTLTLYDSANEPFMASINSLFGHYCMQASQRMSRFVAKRVIGDTVQDVTALPSYIAAESNDYASDMQNEDGGIAPYPGSESDYRTSTYVAMVATDQFDLKALARYYRTQLDTLKETRQRSYCYLGLAVTGEIEKEELEALIADKNADLSSKAYYIAGLAYLGEMDAAMQYYNDLLAPHVAKIHSSQTKDYAWEEAAAASWIAASRLGHPDADALSLYYNNVWRIGTLFECMVYVTNYDKPVTPTSFTYTAGGEAKAVNFGYAGMTTLVLNESDLEGLAFQNVPETVKAVAYYMGEPSELGLEASPNMSVEKTITPLDDMTYEVDLMINLTKDAPEGQYDISDWVPSNTRLYSYDKEYSIPHSNSTRYYFRTTSEGQNLYVSFHHNFQEARTIHYKYRVRRTFQGEAALDTVYMIHGDSGENCNTQKGVFKP